MRNNALKTDLLRCNIKPCPIYKPLTIIFSPPSITGHGVTRTVEKGKNPKPSDIDRRCMIQSRTLCVLRYPPTPSSSPIHVLGFGDGCCTTCHLVSLF